MGPGASPVDPYLLRVAEAAAASLVAPYETKRRVASQRGPRGMPPAPPAALSARIPP